MWFSRSSISLPNLPLVQLSLEAIKTIQPVHKPINDPSIVTEDSICTIVEKNENYSTINGIKFLVDSLYKKTKPVYSAICKETNKPVNSVNVQKSRFDRDKIRQQMREEGFWKINSEIGDSRD